MTRRSYVHRGGKTPLLGVTVGSFVSDIARRFGECDAIVSIAQRQRLSYRQLMQEADDMARGLLALGVARGDRVAIWSTDNVEWVIIQMATARIGAVLVNINPAYRVAELEIALKLARVQTLVTIPRFRKSMYVEMIRELCPEADEDAPDAFRSKRLPDLRRLVIYDPEDRAETARPASAFHTWREVVERGRSIASAEVAALSETLDSDDPINMQFTSGTTGFPKPVVLTHHNIINNGYFIGEAMRFTAADRLCVPVPFYHCFGMVVSNLACLTHGASIVIPSPHFDAGATLAAVHDERCTAVHGVPTMFIAELDRPDFGDYDLSSLRTGIMAGAPCPPELVRRVMEDMGCREILIGYGQTESSPVTHLTHPEDDFRLRVETVGTNLPHQEVKIVDPDDSTTVAVGEPGEICFRGYHVMRGYFQQPEDTAKAIDEAGWLHSGDLGVLDDNGYLRITGRLKDMIIRGGENIYPAEIEALYYEHPDVAEVAVFGIADERLGEEVGAWIRPREGSRVEPQELQEWARARVAHFKVPRHIWLVDEFPMTVTGKIQKFRIREIVEGWMKDDELQSSPSSRRPLSTGA